MEFSNLLALLKKKHEIPKTISLAPTVDYSHIDNTAAAINISGANIPQDDSISITTSRVFEPEMGEVIVSPKPINQNDLHFVNLDEKIKASHIRYSTTSRKRKMDNDTFYSILHQEHNHLIVTNKTTPILAKNDTVNMNSTKTTVNGVSTGPSSYTNVSDGVSPSLTRHTEFIDELRPQTLNSGDRTRLGDTDMFNTLPPPPPPLPPPLPVTPLTIPTPPPLPVAIPPSTFVALPGLYETNSSDISSTISDSIIGLDTYNSIREDLNVTGGSTSTNTSRERSEILYTEPNTNLLNYTKDQSLLNAGKPESPFDINNSHTSGHLILSPSVLLNQRNRLKSRDTNKNSSDSKQTTSPKYDLYKHLSSVIDFDKARKKALSERRQRHDISEDDTDETDWV